MEVEYVHMWLFVSGPTANWLTVITVLGDEKQRREWEGGGRREKGK